MIKKIKKALKWKYLAFYAFGVPVYIHITMIIIPVFLLIKPTATTIFIGILISVALHEMGHFFSGKYFGIEFSEIGINPLFAYVKPITDFGNIPIKPSFLISISGVIVNLILFIVFRVVGGKYFLELSNLNMYLVILNIMPFPFFDGGKVAMNIIRIIFKVDFDKAYSWIMTGFFIVGFFVMGGMTYSSIQYLITHELENFGILNLVCFIPFCILGTITYAALAISQKSEKDESQ